MASRFAQYTKGESHIIVVGRNQEAARATISSFPPSGSKGTYKFVGCDAMLMKNVATTAASLLARLPKLDFLVLSPAFFTTGIIAGRDETPEGIDKKLALLYYARWKFIYDLMPLLSKASEDAKVYSILGAGAGGKIDLGDLGLKKRYTELKAAMAAQTLGSRAALSPHFLGIISVHRYPGSNYFLLHQLEYQLSGLFDSKPGFTRRGAKGDDIGYTAADPNAVKKLWDHTVEATGAQ
ncbi:hypothetical protein DFH06DRAFT_1269244 [Mycena polygramma]|nr:hypothetical protein DFH06DRAFT_1269244 [Mycena polygramma]